MGNSIKTALWLTQNKSTRNDILQQTRKGNAEVIYKAAQLGRL
jgi:hypothetical protein